MLKPSKKGLLLSDVKCYIVHILVDTVYSIKKYTTKEYSDAQKAWSLQDIIGRPIAKDYIRCAENNILPSCPTTKADYLQAEDILWSSLDWLKGKMSRKTPS